MQQSAKEPVPIDWHKSSNELYRATNEHATIRWNKGEKGYAVEVSGRLVGYANTVPQAKNIAIEELKKSMMNTKIGLSHTPPASEARPLGTPPPKRSRREQEKYAAYAKKSVDNAHQVAVTLPKSPMTAQAGSSKKMTLTYKGLSKNGKQAFYSGAVRTLKFSLAVFPDKTAPDSITVDDGAFRAAGEKKAKMSKEERAALPKPTLAEVIKRREAALEKLKAKAEAELVTA